jgi:hypothetical protein
MENGMSSKKTRKGQRATETPRSERPEASTDDLPPAHPQARPEEPKPLDDVEVPALTDPGETKGG